MVFGRIFFPFNLGHRLFRPVKISWESKATSQSHLLAATGLFIAYMDPYDPTICRKFRRAVFLVQLFFVVEGWTLLICVCIYIYRPPPRLCIYIYTYIPRTCLSSILVVEPSKTRSFPIKTRVIWVLGLFRWRCDCESQGLLEDRGLLKHWDVYLNDKQQETWSLLWFFSTSIFQFVKTPT